MNEVLLKEVGVKTEEGAAAFTVSSDSRQACWEKTKMSQGRKGALNEGNNQTIGGSHQHFLRLIIIIISLSLSLLFLSYIPFHLHVSSSLLASLFSAKITSQSLIRDQRSSHSAKHECSYPPTHIIILV